ncbi:MAG: hypothetical protein AAF357_09770 [Verrucomicrobiota bacterium]
MKTILLTARLLTFCTISFGFKMAGSGENRPRVHSFSSGAYYVRTTPKDNYGEEGFTQVFKVGKVKDELIDEYPVFMRGELFLEWSPIRGKWCLVHVEPVRITDESEFSKIGLISRLRFFMGGKELRTYSSDDLEELGLRRMPSFEGISQIPSTNRYVFKMWKFKGVPERAGFVAFDVTTGQQEP